MQTHYTFAHNSATYKKWESQKDFAPQGEGEPFTIILPPPNITGRLHIGHAFEHTLIDIATRKARMEGKRTSWLPGLDHAAIATNALLDRKLASEGLSRSQIGREAFNEYAWAWKSTCSSEILDQMRQLGDSCDWASLLFTMDPAANLATHQAFSTLFARGLIYKANRETWYCAKCSTTLSDIEIEDLDTNPRCSRCSHDATKRSSLQWFLRTSEMANRAADALRSGRLQISPPSMEKEYLRWCDQMQDWCISRQLWWAHRIPIWYSPEGEICSFPPGATIPEGYTQEEDTLDTWFSSALWPITTAGFPGNTDFIPNAELITGYDLIFFWSLRMMMLCEELTGEIPFRKLTLHGMIRDEHGQKISKSKNNAIDPQPYMDDFGSDSLRWALYRKCTPGTDIPFGDQDIKHSQSFMRKLWAIANYAHINGATWSTDNTHSSSNRLDSYLLASLSSTIEEASSALSIGNGALACESLWKFISEDLSSFYIPARRDAIASQDSQSLATLSLTISTLLKLLHPIIPFITQELAEELGFTGSLDYEAWPSPEDANLGSTTRTQALLELEQLQNLIARTREYRHSRGIPTKIPLKASINLRYGTSTLLTLLNLTQESNLSTGFTIKNDLGTLLLEDTQPTLPDTSQPRSNKASKKIAALESKLRDPNFLSKAPEAAISKAKGQLAQLQSEGYA